MTAVAASSASLYENTIPDPTPVHDYCLRLADGSSAMSTKLISIFFSPCCICRAQAHAFTLLICAPPKGGSPAPPSETADVKTLILSLLLAALPAVPAQTQPSAEQKAQAAREAEDRLHNDFGWLARYQDANARISAPVSVVFMGDSITQGWYDMMPGFFTPGRVGRGIGGQTTTQMLVRFRQDVIDLHPKAVQIMAGTNDIAGNTGPMTPEQTEANLLSMAELARAHGIRVIFASIPPSDHFPWRPGLAVAPRIAALNTWMKDYAARTGATYADYWSALHDGDALRPSLTYDGVHPNKAGYAVMAPVAEAAIHKALATPAPRAIVR
jgi:lysophospholipase L1-like esterase